MKKPSGHGGTEGVTPSLPKFGMRWFQYNPAYHMAATLKASAQEKADYLTTPSTWPSSWAREVKIQRPTRCWTTPTMFQA
jgi:hypothetical protein